MEGLCIFLGPIRV